MRALGFLSVVARTLLAVVMATPDPEVSRKSREFAVSYFARHLAAP